MALDPKPGKSGNLATPADPAAAGEALDGNSGGLLSARDAAIKKKMAQWGGVKVLPTFPRREPEPIVEKPEEPPPAKKGTKPCSLSFIKVSCEHKPNGKTRYSGPGEILEVVPTASKDVSSNYDWLEMTPIKVKGGGTDTITIAITSKDNQDNGKKESCIKASSADPADSDWKPGPTGKYAVKAPTEKDWWPYYAQPETHYVHGRGCDDTAHSRQIDVFPSQQFTFELDQEVVDNWKKEFKDGVVAFLRTKLCQKIKKEAASVAKEKAMGLKDRFFKKSPPKPAPLAAAPPEEPEEKPEEEGDELGIKLDDCKPKLTLTWGWKEEDDWRAYYLAKIEGKLDPLFGWRAKYEFSLGKLVLAGFGIVPPLSDLVTKVIADITLIFSAKITFVVAAAVVHKRYTDNSIINTGSTSVTGKGIFGIALAVRVGSKYLVGVVVSAGGETTLTAVAAFEIDADGVFFVPKLAYSGLEVIVKVELLSFIKTAKEFCFGKRESKDEKKTIKERSWTPIKGGPLYPKEGDPEARFKMWPRPTET